MRHQGEDVARADERADNMNALDDFGGEAPVDLRQQVQRLKDDINDRHYPPPSLQNESSHVQ